MKIEIDNCYNLDCKIGMQLMKEQGIKANWCITDPPYGNNYASIAHTVRNTQYGVALAKKKDYSFKEWDSERISKDIFDLMFDRSENQIIYGGNYYTDILPPTKSWLVWYKIPEKERVDYPDCELAWCSKGVARVIDYHYNGMLQGDMKNKDYRFHPTQKPTQMWIKLLNLYTKENDLILDPFAGSQSLRIACHKMKRHYIGFEKDEEYFKKGTKWFNTITAQLSIFDL